MMTKNLFQKTIFFFLFVFVLAGCGVSSSPVSVSQSDIADIAGAGEESGTVAISVDLSSVDLGGRHKAALQKHASITRVSATITQGLFSATQDLILSSPVSGPTASGVFTGLAVGTYNVSISIFAGLELLGTGTSTAIVGAETTTTVSIIVTVPPDETGSLAVNITVIHGTSTPTFTLTITKAGNGAGLVPAVGISCGDDCSSEYAQGTLVFLTGFATSGSFEGFSGDPDCADGFVTMNASKTCTATFTKPVSFAASAFSLYGTLTSVAIGDFNGDGNSDLAFLGFETLTYSVSILLGTGTGLFGLATNFAVVSFPKSVAIGDFNGDGKSDLAVRSSTFFGGNDVSILLNQ